ncbi:type II secretion system F family protein [Chitinimonas sp.]|uniref:type II secretion system F family protein n=1 Tax=Chitinimonas sp. TaxID=1934313 RepID=UPI0035B284FC
MQQFAYRVRSDGMVRDGVLVAAGAQQAETILREQGFEIVEVKPKRSLLAQLQAERSSSVSNADVLEFTTQLATLLDAGLPIDRALKVLHSTLPGANLRAILLEMLADIEKGETLADAFSRHSGAFPRLYVNMVRAGEEGGILPITLRRLIEFYERSIEFRNFLVSSSIYPLTLLVFGISALIVLTVMVIPKFAEVFENMGKALPPAASMLIGLSNTLQLHGLEMLGAIVVIACGFWAYVRAGAGQLWWHQTQLRMPMLGELLLKANLSRACRTLGTLMLAGVPILKSLTMVAQLSDNTQINQALARLERGIRDGEGLAAPIRADRFFPPLLANLVTVGEETGDVGTMLLKVADQYDADVRKVAKRFISLFEPLMIIVMGGLIGAIVLSMLSAIFSINEMGV